MPRKPSCYLVALVFRVPGVARGGPLGLAFCLQLYKMCARKAYQDDLSLVEGRGDLGRMLRSIVVVTLVAGDNERVLLGGCAPYCNPHLHSLSSVNSPPSSPH